MPVLIGVVGLVLFWVGFLMLVAPNTDSERYTGAKSAAVGGALLTWLACSANTPARYTDFTVVKTFDHEGASVVIYDDNLYNMNEKFEKNIPVGADIYVRTSESGWYGGIHWPVEEKQFCLTPFDDQ